jgi:hypothetical protein
MVMKPKITILAAAPYDIKVSRPPFQLIISRAEYMDLLDTVENYIRYLRPKRKTQKHLDKALDIVKEIRFVATFNHAYRKETYDQLNRLLDDMYIELQS